MLVPGCGPFKSIGVSGYDATSWTAGDMRRRDFILGGAAAVWPLVARAQQASLVGFIHAGSASSVKEQYEAFRSGMATFGYSEGRNILYENRFA